MLSYGLEVNLFSVSTVVFKDGYRDTYDAPVRVVQAGHGELQVSDQAAVGRHIAESRMIMLLYGGCGLVGKEV